MGDLELKPPHYSRTIAIARESSAMTFGNAYRWTGAGQAVNKHDSVAIITVCCVKSVQSSRCSGMSEPKSLGLYAVVHSCIFGTAFSGVITCWLMSVVI